MTITCGIDWAENHHDVALVDEAGKLVAKRRISDDVQGYRRLLELLAEGTDNFSKAALGKYKRSGTRIARNRDKAS